MNIEKSNLYIEKRTLSEVMVFLVFVLPLLFSFFIEFLGFSAIIKFTIDIILIAFVSVIIVKNMFIINKALNSFSFVIISFLLYTFIVYVFKFQSLFYYFWGTRNYFRFYVAFFAFALILNEKKAVDFLNILDKLFWVNAAVSVIQIIMGYRQDYLGGLFGTDKGCNGASIVFFIIIIAKSFLQFMNGNEKLALCLTKSAVALIISAFAELKVFFFIFIILLILSAILTSFSWRKIAFLMVSGLLVFVASAILVLIFDYFEGFLSLESLMLQLTLKNYASKNDIGRFTAFSSLSERFLPTIPDQLFGMGLGNCDVSSLDIFTTDFYKAHVSSHYSIFSHAFLFIETGIIGVLIYCSFFVVSLTSSIKRLKINESNKLFCQLAIIMSIMCFILMVYNSSLRTDIGYLVYFILALPFINTNNNGQESIKRSI